MSRLANKPIAIPKGVSVNIQPQWAELKGPHKTVRVLLHQHIKVADEKGFLKIEVDPSAIDKSKRAAKLARTLNAQVGTVWSLLKSNLIGVSEGFRVKLELVGVGYRAAVQGHNINLSLGYSHPIVYNLPKDVSAETPSQTEIVLLCHDKQLLGQVAAEIRSYRPPECYKGKGVKFAGEVIVLKETKKK
jgi:large subunit ribosomal protein L6